MPWASALLLVLQLLPGGVFAWMDAVLISGTGRWIRFALYFGVYLLIGHDILRKAGKGICNRQVFDENFLMAVATVGAMVLAVSSNGDYFEAIAVMLFYQVGEWFQSYAVGKSRRNISQLMDIRPDYANVERDGQLVQVDPDEVGIGTIIVVQPGEKVPIDGIILEGSSSLKDYANVERDGQLVQVDPDEVGIGTIIVVQPGEKVPIDGIILEGSSSLNTSALTGESLPRDAGPGDEIISGCINMTGLLKIRTTKEFGESTVSKILDLVENGESLPRDAGPGDEIISGCINMTGLLKIRTTKEFGESTVSKILDLVENASSKKSKSENFISRFAKVYTPFVCYSALALAVLPPLVRILAMGMSGDWGTWIYRALTFLIISCPCALVISIPLSFFAGIGGASQAGVLVKGSNYLETLSKVKTVVFDKTGTLTQGVFEVNDIHHNEMEREKLIELAALAESASSHPISKSLQRAYGGTLTQGVFEVNDIHHNEMEREKLIELAALAESASSHPISKSLQRAYGMELDRSRVSDIQEISGNGVIAKVDGLQVAAGNDKLMRSLGISYVDCHSTGTIIHMAVKLMRSLGISYVDCHSTGTIIHMAVDGAYAGHIVISDVVKPTAKQAISALKKAGVEQTVMLTGDAKKVADQVAASLGIDQVYSELLPGDKVEQVERLLKEKNGKAQLAFVGDGINDAPVLSRADIGIAMGAMGSDAAIEAADVVLMDECGH